MVQQSMHLGIGAVSPQNGWEQLSPLGRTDLDSNCGHPHPSHHSLQSVCVPKPIHIAALDPSGPGAGWASLCPILIFTLFTASVPFILTLLIILTLTLITLILTLTFTLTLALTLFHLIPLPLILLLGPD